METKLGHTISCPITYKAYNSKLISKKFPKKLSASLPDLHLRTGNFSRF